MPKNLNAAIGGVSLHIVHNSHEIAARARLGLDEKFRREAERRFPNAGSDELEQKVKLIRRLHFLRMAKRSSDKRSRAARRKRRRQTP